MKADTRPKSTRLSNEMRVIESARREARPKPLPAPRPLLYICSEHPLVQQAILSILERDQTQCLTLRPVSDAPAVLDPALPKLALIDLSSLLHWKEQLSKWIASGVRTIALIARDDVEFSEQMRLLNLGVYGIIIISPQFSLELPKAITSVLDGNLWIDSNILQEYVKQTNTVLARLPELRTFTVREEQIIHYLVRGLSNRQIGSLLSISERTVKFHVSNILEKAKVESRRELLQLNTQTVYTAGG
jgi:DNA-binding NarL/FixJ family response regulator